jgi:Protein of unknown function (DUF5672)
LKAVRPKPDQRKRLVAVVTPIVRFPLTSDEEISMCHLRKFLGAFDRYIIGPLHLPKEFSDFTLKPFPAKFFTDRYGYNHLMLTENFYRAFSEYEYILIYQLDCLVFADNLEEWCGKNWDYVGAPWFKNPQQPSEGFRAVGNGGLSLRRVSSALTVLTSKNLVDDPQNLGQRPGERYKGVYDALKSAPLLNRIFTATKAWLHSYGYHNNVRWRIKQTMEYKSHEDFFWALEAPKVMKDFRIPPPHEALAFSMETAPSYCLAENSGKPPFGCHAWTKYDRKLWEPFLLPTQPNPK